MVAPPDSGTEPFLVSQPTNTTQVMSYATGMGGVSSARELDNLAQRGVLETWAAGVPTGWTEGVTSTGNCAQGTSRVAQGQSAARCTLADADDAVTLTSACLTVTGATLYSLSAWARLESGTGLLDLDLIEDDSVDCATPTTTTNVVNDAVPTSDWAKQAGTITTQAGTIRAQVRVSLPAAAAQVLDVDAIALLAGGLATDHYCGADTDATASCSDIIVSTPNPLPANGDAQVSMTISSPVDGAEIPARRVLYSPGTGAADENAIDVSWSQDYLTTGQYQSDGDLAGGGVPAAGNASTNYDVSVAHYSNGRTVSCWDSTCTQSWSTQRNDIASTWYLGGNDTTGSDTAVRSLVVQRMVEQRDLNGLTLLYADQSVPAGFILELACTSGKSITVYWGDGGSTAWVCNGIRNPVTHTYTVAGQYPVTVVGDVYYIKQIKCVSPKAYGDLLAVSGLTSLTYLVLYNTSVSGDISAVGGLTGLTILYLNDTSVSGDISAVSGLTSLTTLHLGGAPVSGDISAVSGLTGLIGLYLYNTSIGGDISAVSGLTSLIYLVLYNTSVSGDISAVSGLTGLTYLVLYNTSVSGNISAVSGLTGLTSLYLNNTSVSGNLSAIKGLASLTVIQVYNMTGRGITYTSAGSLPAWPGANIDIYSSGLDSGEVDAWLNDFDDNLTGAAGDLKMDGDNGNRTSASDAACTAISGDGWGLHVNPDYP